jgi:uncharacterized protein YbjT (DUF2867 family)
MRAGRIAVFGATGTSAGAAARKLIEAGWEVRTVTRDVGGKRAQALAAMGATAVAADIDDRATVRAAIEGCDSVYFAGPSLANRWDIGQAVQGINVADAAAEVGVGHYIFQSALAGTGRGVPSLGSKRAIEERIAELGLPATITRPALFMDNFLTYFPPQERDGTLVLAMALPADKPQAMVSAEDIGRAAVVIAADPRGYVGREIDLIADRVSFAGMAAAIGAAAGRPAAAVSLPLADLEDHWPQGVGLYRWLSERDDAADDVEALPRLIGTPIGFLEWVERNLAPVLR